jgi:hypothetical protein
VVSLQAPDQLAGVVITFSSFSHSLFGYSSRPRSFEQGGLLREFLLYEFSLDSLFLFFLFLTDRTWDLFWIHSCITINF